MNKVTILALILAVIIGECIAAFVFLGKETAASASDAHAKAAKKPAAAHGKPDSGHGKSSGHGGHDKHGGGHKAPAGESSALGVEHGDNREVDLGEYSIMATDPAASTMLLVDFHIFGTVAAEDVEEFAMLYEENRHRIRHQVIIIVRSAEMADLTDPSLGLIRRQILDKVNQLLGKPLVQEAIFSKFSFIEQ